MELKELVKLLERMCDQMIGVCQVELDMIDLRMREAWHEDAALMILEQNREKIDTLEKGIKTFNELKNYWRSIR